MKYPALRFGFYILLAIFCGIAIGASAPVRAQVAKVDASTPKIQHGFTLMAVVRGDVRGQYRYPVPGNLNFLSGPTGYGDPGGIGLWIKGPASAPPAKRPKGARYFPNPYAAPPIASASGPRGEALPARCQPSFAPQYDGQSGTAAPLYLVAIPGGYPAGYGPIDVNLTDSQGRHARWRLTHLPPAYHAISGSVKPRTAFSSGGVKLTVTAWRDNGPAFGNSAAFRSVRYQIQSKFPASTQWLVRITKQQLEWEPLSPAQQAAMPRGYPMAHAPRSLASFLLNQAGGRGSAFGPTGSVQTPYGAHDHYLRLEGSLVQIADADEKVTFHNLTIKLQPNPYASHAKVIGPHGAVRAYVPPPSYEIAAAKQTATTPSGFSVTLLPLSSLPDTHMGFRGFNDGATMLLQFGKGGPSSGPIVLPKSPLYRRYHKPVMVTLQATMPYMLENISLAGFGQGASGRNMWLATLRSFPQSAPDHLPNGRTVYSATIESLPHHLDQLTLTVHEQAELKSIPISFLVPIGNQAPASMRPAMPYPRPFSHPMTPMKRTVR